MNQGGNPPKTQSSNSGGKTIKERLSNITSVFQSNRKRRRPSPSLASPTTPAAASSSGRGSQDRNRRALKSPVLPYFVPTHTPDRPSRPVTDAPSEEECYALLSGKQQQQGAATDKLSISYPTRHDSVGSSGHGSGVLVVHLDSDGPPAYEQPRPAPRPPGSEERRQQYYPSSPSLMRQNSSASSSRSVSPYHHCRHRNKELPPLRIDDEMAARGREDDDIVDGGGGGGGQQLRDALTPSPHAAATTCPLCYRAYEQRDMAHCRGCELVSTVSGSVSSGSHCRNEQQPLKNRPRDLGVGGSDHFSSRVGSFSVSSVSNSSNSRGGSPFPVEVAQGVGVAFTAAPCSPREVEVLGSPVSASARSDVDGGANANPHHTFDFGFSTAAAEERSNSGEAAATTTTAARRHRLVVVEQKPVIVSDGDDEAALDWDAEWNPAYYFGAGAEQNGADGAGIGNDRLSSAVQRQIEADNARGSGGSNDSISPEPTPTSPILSRLPRVDTTARAAGEGVVVKRREEPSSFI